MYGLLWERERGEGVRRASDPGSGAGASAISQNTVESGIQAHSSRRDSNRAESTNAKRLKEGAEGMSEVRVSRTEMDSRAQMAKLKIA